MYLERRNFLKSFAGASALAAMPRFAAAEEQTPQAARGMPAPRIKDISVIECEPAGVRLTVVKITTDQDGLYGYGCATFTQRADLVKPAVEKYLRPFLLGKTTDRIEDIWQSCYDSSYWKNGPVLNNAISGVDQALWDIKGRQAGLPVYQLAGGKCREAADTYAHASGAEFEEVVENARKFMAQGFRHVRVQVGLPGMAGYGSEQSEAPRPKALHDKPLFDRAAQFRRALKLLEICRRELGDDVELLHDMHERLTPSEAVQFCKAAEPYRMFFLEDPLSPEDLGYFRQIRQNCATPIAMGELFNSPHEWQPLITERLIDYIRVHVSQGGRIQPGAQNCNSRRSVRRQDSLAWSGRCIAGGPHGQCHAGPGELQLRDPGVLSVQPADAGDLPRLSRVA
jgi:mannonate dehydratase